MDAAVTSNVEDLLEGILRRAGIRKPDGRPLYAYRTTQSEVWQLARGLRGEWSSDRPWPCSALALVAAEVICRGYRGGTWTWEPLWEELGGSREMDPWLYPRLERGLRWWGVPLVRTKVSTRYLTTVVLQGGLPRHLIGSGAEGGAIGRFLERLLRDHEQYPTVDPVALARDYEGFLPRTLRRAELHELSAALVRAVAELRRKVSSLEDAVRELDLDDPGWRNQLPIHFDGESTAAERLVAGLLAAPKGGTHCTASPALEFAFIEGASPPIVRRLRLPAALAVEAVWPREHGDGPPVVTLLLRSEQGDERRVGEAFRIAGGDEPRYRVDVERENELPANEDLLGEWALVASAPGRPPVETALRGGDSLRDLPWAFEVPSNEEPEGRLAALGSGRTRNDVLLVALPTGARRVSGDWQMACSNVANGRELFFLCSDGQAEIDGERFQWRVGAAGRDEHLLVGRLASLFPVRGMAWSGAPRLRAREDEEAQFTAIPEHELSWRPESSRDLWRPLAHALGTGFLRRRIGDVTLYRTKLTVLPDDLGLEVRQAGSVGTLRLTSRALEDLHVSPRADLDLRFERTGDRFAILVEQRPGTAPGPASMEARLGFGAGRSAVVLLPVPLPLAGFVDRCGQPVLGNLVSFEELRRLCAVVVGGRGGSMPVVIASLAHRPSEVFAARPLFEVVRGRRELRLDAFKDSATELIALDDADRPDRAVRLTLVVDNREVKRLEVREHGAHLIEVKPQKRGTPEQSVLQPRMLGGSRAPFDGLSCKLVPTWRPDTESVPLELGPDGFVVSYDRLYPGPWVAIACGGEGAPSIRPFELSIPECTASPDAIALFAPANDFERACRVPWEELEKALDTAVARIVNLPSGPEWEGLLVTAGTLDRLPAATFWTTLRLVRNPQAVAMVAMSLLNGEAHRAVWRRLEDLTFLWAGVPLAAWRAGLAALCAPYEEALHSVIGKSHLDELAQRGGASHAWLRIVAWWLRIEHGYEDLGRIPKPGAFDRAPLAEQVGSNPQLRTFAAFAAPEARVVTNCIEELHNEMRRAHADDDRTDSVQWPAIDVWRLCEVRGIEWLYEGLQLVPHRDDTYPVLNGPTLAAAWISLGRGDDEEIACVLKRLRAFDRDWFDQALAIQLPRALGYMRELHIQERQA